MDAQNIQNVIYLSLLNIDDCFARNWNFQKVISPFYRIYLVKGGDGQIFHNNKTIELKPGYLYLIPSFSLCNYSSSSYFEHFYIHFIPQLGEENTLFNLLDFNYEVKATEEDIALGKRLLALNPGKKLMNTDPSKYSKSNLFPSPEVLNSPIHIATYLETQGILLRLFSRFIKDNNKSKKSLIFYQKTKISKAVLFIQQNINRPIKLEELAEECNLSKDYFSRLFLKIMGTRPIDYINRKKIELAQLRLIITSDTIEKIALDIGVDNFSYFTRMFKKYSCATPGEYRKLHKLI